MATQRYAIAQGQKDTKVGSLLYATEASYDTSWKNYLHTHYFSELFYITAGSGQFRVEQTVFAVRQGDVVLVNPYIQHTELSHKAHPLSYLAFGIEGLQFGFETEQNFAHLPLAPNSQDARLLFEILDEMQKKQPHYERVCQNGMETFLLRFSRGQALSLVPTGLRSIPSECRIVKKYLDAHETESITLDDLAALVHLNKYYLAHLFTAAYGVPPIRYLTEQKLRCAKEHLTGFNLSIAQVAAVCGFSSAGYFAQVFRKANGITPAEYRKRARLEKQG